MADSRQKSMTEMIFKQFVRHRLAVGGLIVLVVLGMIAVFAPFVSSLLGHHPDNQNVFERYRPVGTQLIIPADKREIAIEQFVERQPEKAKAAAKSLVELSLAESDAEDWEEPLFSFIEGKEPKELLTQLNSNSAASLLPLKNIITGFSKSHVLGTDELGRDVLVRLIYAARVSIGVGIVVAIVSGIIGLLIGCLAGYYGGVIDTLLMRFTESVLALPFIPLMIVFISIDFNKIPLLGELIAGENQSIYKMIFVLCFFQWMTPALLIRASILSIKEQDFIQAANALGAFDFRIITRHIIPNVLAPLIVSVTLGVGTVINFEAALSFLGLGIQPPTPSWGNMLNNAQELIYEAPFLAILPGLLIIITVSCFNFLGDGLQDALDPKAIKRGD